LIKGMTGPMSTNSKLGPGATARRLVRTQDRAVLSTLHGDREGWPHGSLVLTASEHDGTPLLLISDLAEHTRNIKRDPRVSLLFNGTDGLDDPLTGPRATILGHARVNTSAASRARFLARHQSAEIYAGFADFYLYAVDVESAHVVAGFGDIDWVDGVDVLGPSSTALIEQEVDIVAHMNDDHADALNDYATRLLSLDGVGWRMTGCDSEGLDLRLGGGTARLAFEFSVTDAAGARAELVRLVKQARGVPPDS
jgi:heme iron utilization protein